MVTPVAAPFQNGRISLIPQPLQMRFTIRARDSSLRLSRELIL
jgi:hypothetical protein